MELGTWSLGNPVPNQMLWKGAARGQIDRFWKLAKDLGVTIQVVSNHTSKFIVLPVVELTFPGQGRIMVRDNFHDVEFAVLWDKTPVLSYDDVYGLVCEWDEHGRVEVDSWTWCLKQVGSCEGYSWKGWTPAELADPRITRVEVFRSDGSKYWVDKNPEEKDRWNKRMTDPEWLCKNWSSGGIFYEGVFGPGVKMYVGRHTFLQGIAEVIPATAHPIFTKGRKDFTVSSDWDSILDTINRIRNAPIAS